MRCATVWWIDPCRHFASNIIEGRYTSSDLRKMAIAGNASISSIDGREFKLSYFESPWDDFVIVGDIFSANFGYPKFSSGNATLVGERKTKDFTLLEVKGLVSINYDTMAK